MSTPPSGFQPASAPPQGKSKKGCIIAVVVVLFLVIAGCFGACFMAGKNAGKLMAWGMDKMRPEVVAALDSNADQATKDSFLSEFDAVKDLAAQPITSEEDGKRLESVGEAMRILQEIMGDKNITQDEMERFIAAARQARGASE